MPVRSSFHNVKKEEHANDRPPLGGSQHSRSLKDKEIIDLCSDTEDEAQKPSKKPAATSVQSRVRRNCRSVAKSKNRFSDDEQEDDDDDGNHDDDNSDYRADDLAPSSSKTKPVKLYAVAKIVTLATDSVESVSESTDKLASVDSGILSRITKSLALAKHPGTGEAEARQALRLATRLMSAQNLTQADLLAASTSSANQTRAGMSVVEILSQTKSAPRNESWVNQVAIAINTFFDVKAYSTSYANRTKLSWTFYGLSTNTVAAAYAFEMVHNQILTWATQKTAAKELSGKTAKNSYCQGVAAGLIHLAKKEKKEELQKAIQTEKKRIQSLQEQERVARKKELDRLNGPPSSSTNHPVKPEPGLSGAQEQEDNKPSIHASSSRAVKLEDVVDEEDVKPFSSGGIKRSSSFDPLREHSQETQTADGRWAKSSDTSEDEEDQFYDFPVSDYANQGDTDLMNDGDIKPDFDESSEPPLPTQPDLKAEEDDHKKDIKNENDGGGDGDGEGWRSSGQLIRFRQDAAQIADQFLADQHSDLKLKKRKKSTYVQNSHAFHLGRQDASKIDLKRKRIKASSSNM